MERLEIIGTMIASVLTAVGGFEAIKYYISRDTNKRIVKSGSGRFRSLPY